MRKIARRLIDEEHDANDPNAARAAFRVCHKLGKSLSVLTGSRGFASLFARALSRAGEEVPWLNELLVDANGALTLPSPEAEAKVNSREAAKGGLALVTHLLELLATFIGEALTLRLVQQVWPKVALNPETT
jgi:hypothetical protein